MSNNPYQQYKNVQYETAGQEQLLLMMYESAIKFCRQACAGIEKNELEYVNNKLQRVQAIIDELIISLDMEKGGGLARNLYNLYEYIKYSLIKANLRKDPAIINEVLVILQELNESWEQVINMSNRNKIQYVGGLNVEG